MLGCRQLPPPDGASFLAGQWGRETDWVLGPGLSYVGPSWTPHAENEGQDRIPGRTCIQELVVPKPDNCSVGLFYPICKPQDSL